jgi:carbon monoxide dehydrogenase subunit G
VEYRHKVFIACPVSRVFAYMDDVEREPEWQPGIKRASKDPPGPTAVGTRKRYTSEFMGNRIVNTYVTKVFEPDQLVTYETTKDSVLQARVDLTFKTVDAGTEVTMAVRGKATGVLRFVPKTLMEGVFRKELETSLGLLKSKLEATN